MKMNYLLPLLVLLLCGGYAAWARSKANQAIATLGPAMHGFFAKTGFRFLHLPPEPIELHVQHAMADAQNQAAGDRVIEYARSFLGQPIHFRQAYVKSPEGFSISGSWSAPMSAPPRIPFHIADRSLSSVGKAVREAFSNSTRLWEPRFPHAVQTGIPEIDSRFVVFGVDPNAVRWLFQQNQALCAALLVCAEVDLWVDDRAAVFADPMQKNMNAGMGGMVGSMAMGFDYGKRMDMSIPVHDRMSEILALAVRTSRS